MDAGVTAGVKIEIEIERGVAVFLKVTFFFFGRYNISVNITENSIIIISSASEILILKVDLIHY